MIKTKKRVSLLLALALVFSVLAGCGDPGTGNGAPDPDAPELDEARRVPTLTLHTTTAEYDPIRNESALLIAQWWGELGLDVNVRPLEFTTLLDTVRNREPEDKDWHGFILGWSGRVERADPDMFLYSLFHSSQAGFGGNNMFEYRSDEYDALAEAQRREMDVDARREIAIEAQDLLQEDIPALALFYRDEIQAYNNERWADMTVMAGEGLYHEWQPYHATPLTDDAELRIANTQDLDTFNPLSATAVWEWKLLRMVYDKLVRVTTEFEPEPWAAESIDVIDDTTVDVVLREGMTFHDGEPVRPEDVKFTFDYMIDWGVGYFDAFLNPVESVELLDDGTIRFELVEPYAPFLTNTLGQIPILPEHIWATVVEDQNLDHPDQFENVPAIGSGPMTFDVWERGEFLRLRKFEDHFAADDMQMEAMNYIIYGHAEGVFGALENQQADMNAWRFEPEYVQLSEDMDLLTVTRVPDIGFYYLGFNLYQPPFNDLALRQAATSAIDFNEIVDVLMYGYGDAGGPGAVISTGNEFWRSPNLEVPDFDIEYARQILADAGYEWDAQGNLYYPAN